MKSTSIWFMRHKKCFELHPSPVCGRERLRLDQLERRGVQLVGKSDGLMDHKSLSIQCMLSGRTLFIQQPHPYKRPVQGLSEPKWPNHLTATRKITPTHILEVYAKMNLDRKKKK